MTTTRVVRHTATSPENSTGCYCGRFQRLAVPILYTSRLKGGMDGKRRRANSGDKTGFPASGVHRLLNPWGRFPRPAARPQPHRGILCLHRRDRVSNRTVSEVIRPMDVPNQSGQRTFVKQLTRLTLVAFQTSKSRNCVYIPYRDKRPCLSRSGLIRE